MSFCYGEDLKNKNKQTKKPHQLPNASCSETLRSLGSELAIDQANYLK